MVRAVLREGFGIAWLVAAFFVLAGTVEAAPTSTPTITEPSSDGQQFHPADVHMEVTGFSDADGDMQQCSDWEIRSAAPFEVVWQADCATGLGSVHIHLGDGTFVNSLAGHTRLDFDTDYTLRVRFRDSAGELGSYEQRAFRTFPSASPGGAIAWTPVQPGFVVEEVGGGFQLPVNVAFAPQPGLLARSPLLYVTELYGKIKVVSGDHTVGTYASNLLNFNPTGNFPGSGEQGLTGLVVDPRTGDLFASLLYDANPPERLPLPQGDSPPQL